MQAHRDCLAAGADKAPSTGQNAARVVEALRAGKPVPPNLGQELWQAGQAQTFAKLAEEAIVWGHTTLAGERDDLVRDGLPTLLGVLHSRVCQAVEQARTVDLGGATDAEDAIRRALTDAWRTMAEARQLYVTSRQAQTVLMAYAAPDTPPDLAGFGFLPAYAQRFPGWSRFAGRVTSYVDGTRDQGWEAPPWPIEAGDHEGRFEWLLEHPDVQTWVPTVEQLRGARRAAADVLNAKRPKVNPRNEARFRRELDGHRNAHAAEQERLGRIESYSAGGKW